MTRRKPLNFDISVSAAKKRAAKSRSKSGAVESSTRVCEWPGCDSAGTFRAPFSRDRLDDYRWFCQAHIREYNSRWNFYENMSEDEIAEAMQADRLWGRQTWKLGKPDEAEKTAAGSHTDGEAWRRRGFEDPFEMLGENSTLNPGARAEQKRMRERTLPKTVRRALDLLELDSLATKKDIRMKYKEMVKRYHPDQNGGDRTEEARLSEVLWAWDQLKNNESFPEK